jgi:hypothetical protein
VYAVLAVKAVLAVSVTAVVDSVQVAVVTRPTPLCSTSTTQFAEFVCVFGKLIVASVPVVVLVPVVSVTVPLTPSHTWPLAQVIAGLVPAAAPVASDIVPDPIMNLPDTNPVAVVLPLPVTDSTAAGLAPPLSTENPPVPLLVELLITTAFAPAPELISVWPFW